MNYRSGSVGSSVLWFQLQCYKDKVDLLFFFVFCCFFFLSGVSFTDTDNSQDSRGREGTFFIPLYHFHPLTNIQTFMCNFALSLKPCLNLCPRRRLKTILSLDNIFILSWSLILKIFLSKGLRNFDNALRDIL